MKKFICLMMMSGLLLSAMAQQAPDYSHQNGHAKAVPTTKSTTDITPADINFWVGSGSNSMIAVFYWCQDSTIGIAYGYKWEGIKTIGDMLNAIDSADSRFSINYSSGFINDYAYQDGTYHLYIASSGMLSYTVDGVWAGGLTDVLSNGSILSMEEYGNCETPTNVIAASNPNIPVVVFDGVVGTDSCQAIYCENPNILAWATGCNVTRGAQDIAANPLLVTYGSEQDAIGAATTSSMDVVSLGDSGVAILTFNTPIQDGEGYDFAVFENSLNDIFLELAFVEVSSDGLNYVRFPATSYTQSTTQIGNAGAVDATKINNLAGKYRAGWGTPFDLAELAGNDLLNLNNITHIKLIDVIGTINAQHATRDQYGQIINDPYPTDFYSGGFDLDGIAVLNGWTPGTGIHNYSEASARFAFPNPCTDQLTILNPAQGTIELFNAYGQLLYTDRNQNEQITLNMQNYPAGIYFIQMSGQTVKIVKK